MDGWHRRAGPPPVDHLARRYLACSRWRIETRWHPDGAVVNFLHHGPYERLGTSLSRVGHHLDMMMAPFLFTDDAAPWLVRRREITARETTIFSAEEGSAGVRARLAEGRLVGLATDMPGRTPDGQPRSRTHEPLHPRGFADARALLDAMLRIHEPSVLAWPEMYEEPRSKWGEPAREIATPAA